MKVVHGSADVASHASLKQEGFDSVKIVGRKSGAEYVIYSWDQAPWQHKFYEQRVLE